MSLDRLKWLTIVLAIAFLAFAQAATMFLLEPVLGSANGHWAAVGVLAVGVVIFSTVVFRILGGMQQRIVRQNEELSALNAAARAVSGSLDLQEAVTRALGNVMEVTRASAGEIVVAAEGPHEEPVRLSQGATDELDLLNRLWESDWGHSDASRLTEGIWIVDLEQVQQPAAAEAHGRGFRTAAWVPLRAQERMLGAMKLLAGRSSHLTSEGSERLLAAMGSQIAVAIQASQLFQDVLRRGREAQALYEIGLNIASLQDIEKILHSIVEQAREMLGSETAALCLARGNGVGLTLVGSSGPPEAFQRPPIQVPPFPITLGAASEVSLGPEAGSPCAMLTNEYRASHLSAPLLVGTSMIGELCVSSRTAQRFTERHRGLLAGLADMAAIAINNARLLEGERNLAVLEERERLAGEMHDSLAQVLGYLHLKAQATQRTLSRQDVARAGEELSDMASLAHEAYLDVREAILGLRETVSPGTGITGTLKEYLQKFSRQSGIKVELEVSGDTVPQFSPEVEVQLIRVIQEALTNVRKHANADTTWIRIGPENGEIGICVEDNGQGFDLALIHGGAGRRFGVRIMRERIERVGGRFEIESSPGCGTRVRICFPQWEGGNDGSSENSPGGRSASLQEGPARPLGRSRGYGGGGRGV